MLKLQKLNGRMLCRNGALCGWKLKVMEAVNLAAEQINHKMYSFR
jgi:hypothetical protein